MKLSTNLLCVSVGLNCCLPCFYFLKIRDADQTVGGPSGRTIQIPSYQARQGYLNSEKGPARQNIVDRPPEATRKNMISEYVWVPEALGLRVFPNIPAFTGNSVFEGLSNDFIAALGLKRNSVEKINAAILTGTNRMIMDEKNGVDVVANGEQISIVTKVDQANTLQYLRAELTELMKGSPTASKVQDAAVNAIMKRQEFIPWYLKENLTVTTSGGLLLVYSNSSKGQMTLVQGINMNPQESPEEARWAHIYQRVRSVVTPTGNAKR